MMSPKKTYNINYLNSKLRNPISFALVTFWFCACQPVTENTIMQTDEKAAILKSTILAIPSDSLREVTQLVVLDSLLIFKDYKYDPLYAVFNLKSNRLVKRFGKVGDGPGEFDRYAILQRLSGQMEGLGFCMRLKFRYRSMGMTSLIAGVENYVESGIKLPTEFQQYVLMPNGTYLGVGIFDGRYAFADAGGKMLTPQLDYPFAQQLSNLSFGAKAMLLQGSLLIRPDGQRSLFAYRSFPGWEICQINGLKLQKKSEFLQSVPTFKNITTGNVLGVELALDNIDGFVGASANQEMIVLLYSGRSERAHPGKSSYANQIHLLNWEGKLLAKYKLDRDLGNIALDPANRTIYGFSPEKQPKLVAYELPDIKTIEQ
jgi:hypothetical protein